MDFEAMIRAQVASGKSIEEIAKSMNGALNSIQDEVKKKQEKAKTAAEVKESYIDGIEHVFWSNVKEEVLDISDVTALALLVVQSKYPKWTVEDCEEFREKMELNIKVTAEMQGKSIDDAILDGIKVVTNKFVNTPTKADDKARSDSMKSENTLHNGTPYKSTPKPNVTVRKVSIESDDEWERLKRFIDSL